MNNNTRKALVIAGIAFGFGLVGVPTIGHAATVTYVQTTQGCTGGCGIDANNTVKVSDTGSPGVFDILVTLDTITTPDWSFMNNSVIKLRAIPHRLRFLAA
jgi:hypothetical protein